MHFRLLCILGLLVVPCLSAGGVSAAPTITDVTIFVTAEVAQISDYGGLLNNQIQVGDIVTGYYAYNLATPNTGSIPQVGDYWHYDSPYGISVEVNGLVFQTDPNNTEFLVELVNDYHYSDNYLLRSYHNLPLSEEVLVRHIAWQLDDPTMSALSGVALPATEPDLTNWQSIFGLTLEGCAPSPWTPGECDESATFLVRAHVTSAVRLWRYWFPL